MLLGPWTNRRVVTTKPGVFEMLLSCDDCTNNVVSNVCSNPAANMLTHQAALGVFAARETRVLGPNSHSHLNWTCASTFLNRDKLAEKRTRKKGGRVMASAITSVIQNDIGGSGRDTNGSHRCKRDREDIVFAVYTAVAFSQMKA